MDMLSDSDDESDIKDIEHLNAVLTDEPSTSGIISQRSAASSTISSFSSTPQSTIESKLDTAIALNKLTDEKVCRLEKNLILRLKECRERLAILQKKDNDIEKSKKPEFFRYVHCGRPYFKDKNMFPAPDNEDTILINNLGMFDFSHLPCNLYWTIKEKKKFVNLVHKLSKDMRIKELQSKAAALKRKAHSKGNKMHQKKYADVMKEIANISKKSLAEVVLPIDEDYDWDLIANTLNSRHTAIEYMSFWKLFLHPAINKSQWTNEEVKRLLVLAKLNNNQNWDCIAKDLNTSRSSLQCFKKFRSHLGTRENSAKWTREEEEYFRRVIDFYKEDGFIPWNKVTAVIQNRTKSQMYTKYLRLYSKRTGRFLPEEDVVLLTCVNLFGKDFHKMTQYIPGRTALQLRVRHNVLESPNNAITWTSDEDKKLIQLVENAKRKKGYSFSKIVKHFEGKNRVQLRTRYIILKTWMRRNPTGKIEEAPRRRPRELYQNCDASNLSDAIECLRKRLEQEVENKKSTALSKYSPEEQIDNAIIDMLTEIEKNKKPNTGTPSVVDFNLVDVSVPRTNVNVNNIKSILILLYAKLNKSNFLKSEDCKTFPGLIEETKAMRSYSRKPVCAKTPDIWGVNTLPFHDYVLPPNYDTVVALRKLFSFVKYKPPARAKVLYVGNFVITNPEISEQYTILLYRLKFLFSWVFLLNKHAPNILPLDYKHEDEDTNDTTE